MTRFLNYRLLNLYIFLFCASLLGIAYYMELAMMLEPCPLCITQRIFFFLAGITALIAFVHNPVAKGKVIYGLTSAVLFLAGGGFAIRQLWLQGLPKDQVPACGPSLSYMIDVFPFSEVLQAMLSGDGNCAEVSWVDPVLGLSIPHWTLACFVAMAGVSVFQAFRKRV